MFYHHSFQCVCVGLLLFFFVEYHSNCVLIHKKDSLFFFKMYSIILVSICLIILMNISTSLIAGPK